MKTRYSALGFILLIGTVGYCFCLAAQTRGFDRCYASSKTSRSFRLIHDIRLSGRSAGGTVYLVRTAAPEYDYLALETKPGETAEAVLQRLVMAWQSKHGQKTGVTAVGDMLKGLSGCIGEYAFAGSDRGLAIPTSPLFLSGTYEPTNGKVVFRWYNPKNGYDEPSLNGFQSLGSNTVSLTRQAEQIEQGRMEYFRVVGLLGQTPSSMGLINVSSNSQEELTSAPFRNGITPNWCSWSVGPDAREGVFEQGIRPNGNYYGGKPFTPDGKPFYQIVRTKTAEVQAGIWRKWLGLVPEHKYRVYVRLNTLAMDQNTNDWSLSFHVAATDTKGTDFTTEQFTGKAPLPDGSQGPEAARIALYGPGKTTKGHWVTNTVDIVLPPGVDTLATWLRHSGKDSTGVGLDWIKVEDLSYKPSTNDAGSQPQAPSSGLEGF